MYLSIAVRDHLPNELETCNSLGSMPYISEEDTINAEDALQSKFPLKYFEDGHIQIGEGDDFSLFQLNLLIVRAVNLDALLPEILVFQQIRKTSFLSFKVLGIAIKTKTFQKELHDTINLSEKIVVNLMSTKKILDEFFISQNITISFVCGADKLGITNYELEDAFTKKESKCFFKFPSPNGIVPFNSSDKSPYIQIQTWVEEDLSNKDEDDASSEKLRPRTVYSTALRSPIEQPETPKVPEDEFRNQGDIITPCVTKSVDKVIKDLPVSPHPPLDTYQKYVLEIALTYLYWKTSPPDSKIMFKFLHPKAASCITIFTEINNTVGQQIPLCNLHIKIGYISTPAKIQKLLNIWPPRLVLLDEKERCFSEEQDFSVNCAKDYSIDYEIFLRGLRTLEAIAKVGVKVIMRQADVEDLEDYETFYLLPIILDEVITVKEIVDLESWKIQEHKRFDQELQNVKQVEVEKLQLEWDDKKLKLEDQLQKTIQKCQGLQNELRKRLNNLKTEKSLQRNANGSNLYVDIFRKNYKIYSGDNTKEMIELLSKTQRDNEILKEIIDKQRDKLTRIEKSALTKSQTTSLLRDLKVLEEKFEEVQNAKSYFKDQWKMAVEEIHELRTEDIKNVQLQIQKSKEQLSQLSLDNYDELKPNDFGDSAIDSSRSLKTSLFY